jgi:NAD(P) transhydrogenase subunit alpha
MSSESASALFVARERAAGETRVAVTPDAVKTLRGMGFEVTVESNAGAGAHFTDDAYTAAGAVVVANADVPSALQRADVVVKVGPPANNPDVGIHEAHAIKPGALVVGMLAPHRNLEVVATLQSRGVDALAMELIPRISRAQSMDALSSQASIAGYKAAILAALHLPRYFPNLMTAAGTIPPARVVVMGAGVAGLQAVATARRLGAVVEVSDVRAEVKEQVESLGAKFIPLPAVLHDGQQGAARGGYAREMTAEFSAAATSHRRRAHQARGCGDHDRARARSTRPEVGNRSDGAEHATW